MLRVLQLTKRNNLVSSEDDAVQKVLHLQFTTQPNVIGRT